MKCERLEGHAALITGGGRGIGKAIAQRLYSEKADIVICGTTEDVLKKAAEEIASEGREVLSMVCDVSDSRQVKAMVEKAGQRPGRKWPRIWPAFTRPWAVAGSIMEIF